MGAVFADHPAGALVVEDDEPVREAVSLVLERAGFDVCAVEDGPAALAAFDRDAFEVVVLDVMLPAMDGFDVCRRIRARSEVPIVMLTARTDTEDLVRGLELGADDYITKPFEPAELVARARAAVRRSTTGPAARFSVRDVVVDEVAFRAWKDDEELSLTPTEFRLLAALARRAGQVMTREVLLDQVWGYDYLGDSRLVDMAVRRLRAKLGDTADQSAYITTVRSVGYRFEGG